MPLKPPVDAVDDFVTTSTLQGKVDTLDPPSASPTANRVLIQTALNTSSVGDTVRLFPETTYAVNSGGTQAFTSAGGSLAFCIEIPSGVTLDLNGSDLVLASGTIAILVCNANPNATTDSKIGLLGASKGSAVSSSSNLLTGLGLMRFEGVTDLDLDVKIEGADEAGIYTLNCTRITGDIEATSVTGAGIFLGSVTYPCFDCTLGQLTSYNITANVANSFNYPGNSVYANLERSTIEVIKTRNCTAGVKLDKCVDTEIGIVHGDTCGDTSGNSGLKFQSSTANFPIRTSVGQVHMKAQTGPGLFFDANSVDCSVAHYIGEGNATIAAFPDTWFDGTRPSVDHLYVESAATTSVTLRATAVDYRMGVAIVRNPVAAGQGILDNGAKGSIGQFLAMDDQGAPKMDRGYRSISANSVCVMSQCEIRGTTTTPFQRTVGDKVSVGTFRTSQTADLDAAVVNTDADFTVTPGISAVQQYHTGLLTAGRTVTLANPPGALFGWPSRTRFTFTRTGGGAFNLSIGGLKNLTTNQWCIVEADNAASAWKLVAFGAL